MNDQPDKLIEYYRRPLDDRRLLQVVLCRLVELTRRLMNIEAHLKEIEQNRAK